MKCRNCQRELADHRNMLGLAKCLEWYEEVMGEHIASYHRFYELMTKLNENIGKQIKEIDDTVNHIKKGG